MTKTALALGATLLAGCASGGANTPAVATLLPDSPAAAYICDDGQLLELARDPAAGVMRASRGGETLLLQEQVGVSPPRYVTGSDTLVFAENQVILQRGRELRAVCRAVPAAPETGVIWGTLTKLDRMALVPGTRAKVLLVDAARADAPAVEISSTAIVTRGNQVPLHFRLAYDPARVTPKGMTYRVQARIEAPDGGLQFITDAAVFVLETAEPQPPVALRLVPVSGQ